MEGNSESFFLYTMYVVQWYLEPCLEPLLTDLQGFYQSCAVDPLWKAVTFP